MITCRNERLQFSFNINCSHKLNVLNKNLLSNTGFARRHNSSVSPGRNISIRYILNDRYVTVYQSHSFNIPHLPHALVTTSPRALQRRYWALTMGRWGLKSCENIGKLHLDIRLLYVGVGLNRIMGLLWGGGGGDYAIALPKASPFPRKLTLDTTKTMSRAHNPINGNASARKSCSNQVCSILGRGCVY